MPRKERLAPKLERKPLVNKAGLHGMAGTQNFGKQARYARNRRCDERSWHIELATGATKRNTETRR